MSGRSALASFSLSRLREGIGVRGSPSRKRRVCRSFTPSPNPFPQAGKGLKGQI